MGNRPIKPSDRVPEIVDVAMDARWRLKGVLAQLVHWREPAGAKNTLRMHKAAAVALMLGEVKDGTYPRRLMWRFPGRYYKGQVQDLAQIHGLLYGGDIGEDHGAELLREGMFGAQHHAPGRVPR